MSTPVPVPKTCISAQLVDVEKPLKLQELVIPEPKHDEVVIKLEASGVCHSDLHYREDLPLPTLPITLGHEGVGRVVKLGGNVTTLKLGDRVCVPWVHRSCRECEFCLSGNETVCQTQLMGHGSQVHGTFSQYMIGNASHCRKVPAGLSSIDAAPISCAGVTTYKALKLSAVRPGEWVVVIGAAGGLGHIGVQYAKFMGMKVVGIDVGVEDKLDFMKSLGCDVVLDGKDPKLVEKVISETRGGPHGVVSTAPVPQCVQQAVEYIRPMGTIVCVGISAGNLMADTVLLVAKQVTIKGTMVGTRQDLDEALQIADEGKIRIKVDVRKFKDVNQALDDLASGKLTGRIVLEID